MTPFHNLPLALLCEPFKWRLVRCHKTKPHLLMMAKIFITSKMVSLSMVLLLSSRRLRLNQIRPLRSSWMWRILYFRFNGQWNGACRILLDRTMNFLFLILKLRAFTHCFNKKSHASSCSDVIKWCHSPYTFKYLTCDVMWMLPTKAIICFSRAKTNWNWKLISLVEWIFIIWISISAPSRWMPVFSFEFDFLFKWVFIAVFHINHCRRREQRCSMEDICYYNLHLRLYSWWNQMKVCEKPIWWHNINRDDWNYFIQFISRFSRFSVTLSRFHNIF